MVGALADIDRASGLFTDGERAALVYADAMTIGDVSDEVFERVADLLR